MQTEKQDAYRENYLVHEPLLVDEGEIFIARDEFLSTDYTDYADFYYICVICVVPFEVRGVVNEIVLSRGAFHQISLNH